MKRDIKQFTAGQVAEMINGKLEGDASTIIETFAKIEEAGKGSITFMAQAKYETFFYNSTAAVIIIPEQFQPKNPVSAVLIRVADPYTAFVTVLEKYQSLQTIRPSGIEQPSFIAPSAAIGAEVYIGAFSYISEHVKLGNHSMVYPNCYLGPNVQVGDYCVLHPGVKIYHDCIINNHVVIHAGTVIGADGFGYTPNPDGSLRKVPQLGNVVIEDHVEIGANTAIDRATMGSTLIRKGVKLDNLIQIAHNVVIGYSSVIAGQTGIGGSTRLGNGVMVGGQVAIVEHVEIADGSKIGAKSKVTKNFREKNSNINGDPAFDYARSLKSQAVYRNLPELEKRVKDLELKSKTDAGTAGK